MRRGIETKEPRKKKTEMAGNCKEGSRPLPSDHYLRHQSAKIGPRVILAMWQTGS
jgi:hypothetical protein